MTTRNSHYIHRPTPEGGETDDRFREVTQDVYDATTEIQLWSHESCEWFQYWAYGPVEDDLPAGTIWRIPGSDAPSKKILELAKGAR